MGSINLAALNLANALGAVGGAIALSAGFGTLSTAWAGVLLTTAVALVIFAATVLRFAPPSAAAATA